MWSMYEKLCSKIWLLETAELATQSLFFPEKME